MINEQIIKDFNNDMIAIYRKTKEECNYKPSYFLQLVEREGGYAAAKQLLANKDTQYGLTKLYELNRLDLSMEALVVSEKYSCLFSEFEFKTAERRLKQFGYNFSK